jgi:hypothetical protein
LAKFGNKKKLHISKWEKTYRISPKIKYSLLSFQQKNKRFEFIEENWTYHNKHYMKKNSFISFQYFKKQLKWWFGVKTTKGIINIAGFVFSNLWGDFFFQILSSTQFLFYLCHHIEWNFTPKKMCVVCVFLSLVGEPKNTRLGPSVSFTSEFLTWKIWFSTYTKDFSLKKNGPNWPDFKEKKFQNRHIFMIRSTR